MLILSALLALPILTPVTTAKPRPTPAVPLSFRDFFDPSPRELKPSAKLLSMNGKHVRLTGYMAHMEDPPDGAFYLCAIPVNCDEEGAGTADLPPEAVRVIVRSSPDKVVRFNPRPLIVTGILQIGDHMEANGQVSKIRLILDGPADLPAPARPAKTARKAAHS